VINRDTVLVSPFLQDAGGGLYTVSGDRTSSERVGGALRFDAFGYGSLNGSAVYDFYNQLVSDYAIGIDGFVTSRVTVGADLEYYYPTFDGDSIWNWFSHQATTTLRARGTVAFSRRLDASLSGGIRRYATEGDPDSYAETPNIDETTSEIDPLGDIGARYRWNDGSVGFDGTGEFGDRGHRIGGDLTTIKTFDNGFYDTRLVLSLYDWKDDLRPSRATTSFSYVVGGGISPAFESVGRARLGVEWEHAMNELVGQRFRVLATLTLAMRL
jgi:hypothetical protein